MKLNAEGANRVFVSACRGELPGVHFLCVALPECIHKRGRCPDRA
jgi:hypothetical protein